MNADLYVCVDDAGRHQPYRLAGDGLHRIDVGQPFTAPREAIDFCNRAAANAAARGAENAHEVDADSGSGGPRRPGASYSVNADRASRTAAASDLARVGISTESRDEDRPPSEVSDRGRTSFGDRPASPLPAPVPTSQPSLGLL